MHIEHDASYPSAEFPSVPDGLVATSAVETSCPTGLAMGAPPDDTLQSDAPELALSAETLVDVAHVLESGTPRSNGVDEEHIRALADVADRLPPIIVHRPTMQVIDGMHRLRAVKLRGARRIWARFFEGDEADAFVLAVYTNISHGLPLSLGDRKAAAGRILESHPNWSDRRIAAATGLAARTVAALRNDSGGQGLRGDTGRRIGKDGKVRPVSSAEGRRIAGELIAENPELTLRAVASKAGISPETARDVRNRVKRGEDPAPARGAVRRAPATRDNEELARAHRRELLHRLRSDPALRLTEPGRFLLRLLGTQAIGEEGWQRIAASVPPHSREMIVHAARECAQVWEEFALRLKLDTNLKD